MEGEHGHPPPGVQREEGQRLGNDQAPPDCPVLAEAQHGEHDQQGHGQEPVDEHEQRAEPVGVASDHRPRSLEIVVRPGNGTEALSGARSYGVSTRCGRAGTSWSAGVARR